MIYGLLGIVAAFCAYIQWGDEIPLPNMDFNKKEAKYILNVNKAEEKEKFEKAKLYREPTGYMTIEEYEELSIPKDRMTIDIEIPNEPLPSDMIYVPKPSYKLVRYNNPPGSPELTLKNDFYTNRQQNAQGIVSPDFKRLVYPSIYYYPNSGSTASDIFVINLNDAKSNTEKVLTANVIHRMSEPILSTEKDNGNYYTFRTLTPVDFSSDGSKILIKEKIGNTKDGIWKTVPYVYDFNTETSYNLEDIRHAITYYWKSQKNLNLNDKRWDITPLGFSGADTIIVKAVAYTGEIPIDLGIWSISSHGESPKKQSSVPQISMNGYKLVKNGVVAKNVVEKEQKLLEKTDKEKAKLKKKEDKNEIKELTKAYKTKIKQMDHEYEESQKDYNLRQKINGSTEGTDAMEKYKEIKEQQAIKRLEQLEKQKQKELERLEKQKEKIRKIEEKQMAN